MEKTLELSKGLSTELSKSHMPIRFYFTNVLVVLLAAGVILFSGAIWIPASRMPRKPGRTF